MDFYIEVASLLWLETHRTALWISIFVVMFHVVQFMAKSGKVAQRGYIDWVSFSRRNVLAQRPRPYCQKLRSPDVNILVSHKTLHRPNHNGQPHNISDPKLGSSEIFQSERSSHGFQYKAPGVDNDLNVLAYSWICLCMQLAYFTFLTVHKDADSQEDRDVPRWSSTRFLGDNHCNIW